MVALRVCEAFVSSQNETDTAVRPFIFLSAEDLVRPLIPARYITTKREAEVQIEEILSQKADSFRGIYIRPSSWQPVHLGMAMAHKPAQV